MFFLQKNLKVADKNFWNSRGVDRSYLEFKANIGYVARPCQKRGPGGRERKNKSRLLHLSSPTIPFLIGDLILTKLCLPQE